MLFMLLMKMKAESLMRIFFLLVQMLQLTILLTLEELFLHIFLLHTVTVKKMRIHSPFSLLFTMPFTVENLIPSNQNIRKL